MLPNLLGIGAPRSGTTFLYTQLLAHPAVYVSDTVKEIHFFDRHLDRGIEWYMQYFPEERIAGTYKWWGEITPAYLFTPGVPEAIGRWMPDAHFLVVLRNPTDRAYSSYSRHVRDRKLRATFEEFLQIGSGAYEASLYGKYLERYFDIFGREKFFIALFEEMIDDLPAHLVRLAEFLEVDSSGFKEKEGFEPVNTSAQVPFGPLHRTVSQWAEGLRKAQLGGLVDFAKATGINRLFAPRTLVDPMSYEVRARVDAMFESDINKLEPMLGRKLDIWRHDRL